MKLQNLSVIFIIIIIPIILILSYYISLQIDTINMQTSYNTKLLDATKEAVEAFEINTLEWNEAHSEVADSKRRDVLASINTFTTSFANSLGIGGTSKEYILSYVPAIVYTLYDGYYIYSPAKTKEVIKDENGVAVYVKQNLVNYGIYNDRPITITDTTYKTSDPYPFQKYDGKLLYACSGADADGKYNEKYFTFDSSKAKESEDYSHILKPFTAYSARYKNGNTNITVNYTLDNYITIYGRVKGEEYQERSGYLIDENKVSIQNGINVKVNRKDIKKENLKEKIAWKEDEEKNKYNIDTYPYVYEAIKNTKVYFDKDGTPFQVSSTGIRTNLEDRDILYKKLSILSSDDDNYTEIFQAINSGITSSNKEVKAGEWYINTNGDPLNGDKNFGQENIKVSEDISAINYYVESYAFTKWVNSNLNNITIGNVQNIDLQEYEMLNEAIFTSNNNPEDENSIFSRHKREIIKQSLISNLNQAITAYSRNTQEKFQLPELSETDWDQILRNVSITAFVQGIPIGMKYYNNYAIATSTLNKEYINPNEIYLSTEKGDEYYHLPGCDKIIGEGKIIGYRNIDYIEKSYKAFDEIENTEVTKYYYEHQDRSSQACYYCLVQRDLYNSKDNDEEQVAYDTALARERYNNRTTRMEILTSIDNIPNIPDQGEEITPTPDPEPEPEPTPTPEPEPEPEPTPDPEPEIPRLESITQDGANLYFNFTGPVEEVTVRNYMHTNKDSTIKKLSEEQLINANEEKSVYKYDVTAISMAIAMAQMIVIWQGITLKYDYTDVIWTYNGQQYSAKAYGLNGGDIDFYPQ